MQRERSKAFLLVSLVLISIFLTQQLWVQFPFTFIPSFSEDKDKGIGYNYILSDVISPEKYLINFGGNYTILYSGDRYDLWLKTRSYLKGIFQKEDLSYKEIDEREIIKNDVKKSINLFFTEDIPIYMLVKVLNCKPSSSIYNSIKNVRNIYIYLGRNPYIVLSNKTNHIKIYNIKVDTSILINTLDEIERENVLKYYSIRMWGIDKDVYIPINTSSLNYIIPYVYVNNEMNTESYLSMESVAKSFFGEDLEYARKIVETDGSVIFLYGQKGLKISKNGLIEYFNTLDENVTERNLFISLNKAVDFITSHLGWPEEAYLSSIEEIEYKGNKGYRFKFTYRVNNLTVYADKNKFSSPIEIEVFNKNVKSYKRYIRTISKVEYKKSSKEKILPPEKVIEANLSMIKADVAKKNNLKIEQIDNFTILSLIDDIELGYFDYCDKKYKQKLIGVWVIEVNGITYIFDMHDGKFVNGGLPE
ncbi:two-component system activity regulator YycH [Caloranaerobacter ferrireducens]|uniref:two-component system activity regulator YycH n=1 Tax=Caloranaerobacter ferrireducens TaxID=1323370 RepID=UPI00084CEB8B|nr:two-component system activity regulator YycH [Caloranaerobacter ferrireducens]